MGSGDDIQARRHDVQERHCHIHVSGERGEICVLRRPQSWAKAKVRVVTAAAVGAVAAAARAPGMPMVVVRISWSGEGGAEFFSFKTAAGMSYTLTGL